MATATDETAGTKPRTRKAASAKKQAKADAEGKPGLTHDVFQVLKANHVALKPATIAGLNAVLAHYEDERAKLLG